MGLHGPLKGPELGAKYAKNMSWDKGPQWVWVLPIVQEWGA